MRKRTLPVRHLRQQSVFYLQAREAAQVKDPYTRMLDAYEPTLHHLLQSGGATPPDKVLCANGL